LGLRTREQLGVDECIEAYVELSKKQFKVEHVLMNSIPRGGDKCRFSSDLEIELKKMENSQAISTGHAVISAAAGTFSGNYMEKAT
jgi:hypothetical protein